VAVERHAHAHRQLAEHVVAGLVPERVVDALEIVQVDEQQGQFAAVGMQGQQPVVERFAERQAIGQAGQRIGVGHAADFAVVARDARAHARERAEQLADFVVAGAVGQRRGLLGRATLFHRPGQRPDRLEHAPFEQVYRQQSQQHQREQHDREPHPMLAAGGDQVLVQRCQDARLRRTGSAGHEANADAARAAALVDHRRRDVEQFAAPLQGQRARGQCGVGQRIDHRLADMGADAAVVEQSALCVVDHDVLDIGLMQRGARGEADAGAVSRGERRGHGARKLYRQLPAAALQAVARERRHCGVGMV
jgi:hypothetical protein